MAAVRRFLVHRGLVTVLVFLLVLPAPLIWMGSSTSLLDPVLYSAVIEADVEIDAECNLVSWQVHEQIWPAGPCGETGGVGFRGGVSLGS